MRVQPRLPEQRALDTVRPRLDVRESQSRVALPPSNVGEPSLPSVQGSPAVELPWSEDVQWPLGAVPSPLPAV
jgi:hypothetical protein